MAKNSFLPYVTFKIFEVPYFVDFSKVLIQSVNCSYLTALNPIGHGLLIVRDEGQHDQYRCLCLIKLCVKIDKLFRLKFVTQISHIWD